MGLVIIQRKFSFEEAVGGRRTFHEDARQCNKPRDVTRESLRDLTRGDLVQTLGIMNFLVSIHLWNLCLSRWSPLPFQLMGPELLQSMP